MTVGSIHGGTKYNIIPDEVRLQLTIRAFKPEVWLHILDALVTLLEPMMGSEDFGGYGLDGHQIPTVLFRLGANDAPPIARSKAT